MQIFRLVKPGEVDKVIGFDSLPKSLTDDLEAKNKGTADGFPRHWKDFFGIKKTDINPRPFYVLDYWLTNRDKEKWQEICNYVRKVADKNVRLLDKMEDMAKPFATDSYGQLELEPEDIPVIPIPKEETEEIPIAPVVVTTASPAPSVEIKKRGRPRKEPVAA